MTEQQKKQIIIERARNQVIRRLTLYNEYIKYDEPGIIQEVFFILSLMGCMTFICFMLIRITGNFNGDPPLVVLGKAFFMVFVIITVLIIKGRPKVDNNQAATIYEKPELSGKYARLKSQSVISFECIIRDDTLLNTLYDELYTYKRVVDSEDLGILTISRLKTLSLASSGNDKDTTVIL